MELSEEVKKKADQASSSLGKTQTPGDLDRKAFKQGYLEGYQQALKDIADKEAQDWEDVKLQLAKGRAALK